MITRGALTTRVAHLRRAQRARAALARAGARAAPRPAAFEPACARGASRRAGAAPLLSAGKTTRHRRRRCGRMPRVAGRDRFQRLHRRALLRPSAVARVIGSPRRARRVPEASKMYRARLGAILRGLDGRSVPRHGAASSDIARLDAIIRRSLNRANAPTADRCLDRGAGLIASPRFCCSCGRSASEGCTRMAPTPPRHPCAAPPSRASSPRRRAAHRRLVPAALVRVSLVSRSRATPRAAARPSSPAAALVALGRRQIRRAQRRARPCTRRARRGAAPGAEPGAQRRAARLLREVAASRLPRRSPRARLGHAVAVKRSPPRRQRRRVDAALRGARAPPAVSPAPPRKRSPAPRAAPREPFCGGRSSPPRRKRAPSPLLRRPPPRRPTRRGGGRRPAERGALKRRLHRRRVAEACAADRAAASVGVVRAVGLAERTTTTAASPRSVRHAPASQNESHVVRAPIRQRRWASKRRRRWSRCQRTPGTSLEPRAAQSPAKPRGRGRRGSPILSHEHTPSASIAYRRRRGQRAPAATPRRRPRRPAARRALWRKKSVRRRRGPVRPRTACAARPAPRSTTRLARGLCLLAQAPFNSRAPASAARRARPAATSRASAARLRTTSIPRRAPGMAPSVSATLVATTGRARARRRRRRRRASAGAEAASRTGRTCR